MRVEPRPRAEPEGLKAPRRRAGDTVCGPADPLPRAPLTGAETLPQAPFGTADELSCYYDAPTEPCNVHIEVWVSGHLEEAALRRATEAALAEQRRALVRRARGGWWRRSYAWEVPRRPDLDPLSATTWSDERELAQRRMQFLAASPPLDSSPPVRLLLAAGPGEDCLILNAHHAALDGISCLELLLGVARHYQGAADPAAGSAALGADPAALGADPAALAAAVPALARHSTGPVGSRPDGPGRPARARSLLPRPAARIAAELASDPGRGPADRSGYGFRLITCERVPRAPRTGTGPHATVNDLLIAALMVAIGRWNASHGRSPDQIRITMPVNARAPGQDGAAGNLSRLTAVTARPPAQGGDLRPLIANVAAQTLAAKNRPGPQVEPLSQALAAAWCPAAVKHRLLRLALRTAGPLICDSSLVSNLGIVADPPRFGPAPATHLWFSTSAHMPRGLSVGAITLGGKLHLCLRYRHALFSEPAAARFADAYAAALSDITSLGVESDRQH
jgi:NRPS condensation-like uncharacterized protein